MVIRERLMVVGIILLPYLLCYSLVFSHVSVWVSENEPPMTNPYNFLPINIHFLCFGISVWLWVMLLQPTVSQRLSWIWAGFNSILIQTPPVPTSVTPRGQVWKGFIAWRSRFWENKNITFENKIEF